MAWVTRPERPKVISDPKNVADFSGNFVANFRKKNNEFLERGGGGGSFPMKNISLRNFWITGKKAQHSFPKRGRRGGGQRPFGILPKNSSNFENPIVPNTGVPAAVFMFDVLYNFPKPV